MLILAAFGGLMYLRNRLIPRFADDYPFSFIWDGKKHGNLSFGKQRYRRVRTIRELASSQVSHYFTWGGRTVGESLNQLFLMCETKLPFDIVNTAVTAIQLLLCDAIGRGKVKPGSIPSSLMKALAAGYWFSTPDLPVTTLWQTGAMNYSWPGVLQSLFLLPYSLKTENKSLKIPLPAAVLSGLLAGWSNESGGGTACLLSGAALLSAKAAKEDSTWELAGFIAACMGFALLMLSPGNFKRFKIEQEHSDILPEDFSNPGAVPPEYVYRPEMFLHFFNNGFLNTILKLLPLQLPVLLYLLGNDKSSEATKRILALNGASIMVPTLLMFSPEFPERAAYPSVLYSLSAISGAWEHIDPEGLCRRYGRLISAAKKISFAYLGVNVISSILVDADWGGQIRETEEILRERSGEESVTVPQTVVPPVWSALAGDRAIEKEIHEVGRLEENWRDPYNKAIAAYYDIGTVRAGDESEHPYRRKGSIISQLTMPFKRLIKRLREELRLPGIHPFLKK